MTIASGINRRLAYKKETTWGVAAGASGATLMRRKSLRANISRSTFSSEEIVSHFQRVSSRAGPKQANATWELDLSGGTLGDFIAALFRKSAVAITGLSAQTTVTASATAPQFSHAGNGFLTAGLRVGQVVRWTGWTTTATGNNSRNFLITDLTAGAMTGFFLDGTAVTAKAAGDSVSCAAPGKAIWVPDSGHTTPVDSFNIEDWMSDISESELYTGLRVGSIALRIPASGLCSASVSFMGKEVVTAQSAYFSSPNAATVSESTEASNGAISVNGTRVATVTSMDVTFSTALSVEPAVGQKSVPDVFTDRILAAGNMSVMMESGTIRDLYLTNASVELAVVVTDADAAAAGFISICLPSLKLGGFDKDDAARVSATIPFEAQIYGAGGAATKHYKTTAMIHDSAL